MIQVIVLALLAGGPPAPPHFTGKAEVRVASDGSCTVSRSSGSKAIDHRTCDLVRQCVVGRPDLKLALEQCAAEQRRQEKTDNASN
jgi:hypothetical protein